MRQIEKAEIEKAVEDALMELVALQKLRAKKQARKPATQQVRKPATRQVWRPALRQEFLTYLLAAKPGMVALQKLVR